MNMTRLILALAAMATSASALATDAVEVPKRKSGLWEIKTSNIDAKHPGGDGMSMQICIDTTQDDITKQQSRHMREEAEKQCEKLETTKSGDKTVIDSVCKLGKYTATGHTVISGNFSTQYRMESSTEYEPPMFGKRQQKTVMSGKWLGPCKEGQKHGSMSISGMPGGRGFNFNPDRLRQMQAVQPKTID